MAKKEENQTTDEPVKSGPGIMGIVKAIAVVSILIVIQAAGASMFIPSAKETEKIAKDLVNVTKNGGTIEETQADNDSSEIDDSIEMTEVELGVFNMTRYNPQTNLTLNIDIELFAHVLKEENDTFITQFEKNKNRVKEQIIMVLHAVKTKELNDPGLGQIKRLILDKVNKTLSQPLLHEVFITKINFVER